MSYDTSPPVPNTCPLIDDVLERIAEIKETLGKNSIASKLQTLYQKGRNHILVDIDAQEVSKDSGDIAELLSWADDLMILMNNELNGIEDLLEEIRDANDSLRRWGTQNGEAAESLESERDNLKQELEDVQEG